jgi:hypothetical protein
MRLFYSGSGVDARAIEDPLSGRVAGPAGQCVSNVVTTNAEGRAIATTVLLHDELHLRGTTCAIRQISAETIRVPIGAASRHFIATSPFNQASHSAKSTTTPQFGCDVAERDARSAACPQLAIQRVDKCKATRPSHENLC